ncbi:MAG: 16S rRNA (cytosine(1402)-N(4))-methyltransferase RsmH [Chitinophagales bacterium]
MSYHQPVMLQECLDGLNIQPNGIYVDVTFGGGGHSKEILKRLGENGKLFAFDLDDDAQYNKIDDNRFVLIQANFRHIKRFLRLHNITKVDGILADFGVSSHQIDAADRGFSIRYNADLDMRMQQTQMLTAKQVVNTYSADQLQNILGFYGEVPNAKTLANAIVQEREVKDIETTMQLVELCLNYSRGKEHKYMAQVFQAIRIEVNDELNAIKDFLASALEILNVGGRLVTMSYHSLEDRLVKNFIKTGNVEGDVQKDFYGKIAKYFNLINKKPIIATEEEIKENSRARSAKLRIAEKI